MEWKIVPICPRYEASENGDIRMVGSKHIVKPFTDRLQEYPRITYYDEAGKKHKIMVHTMVASAFLGPKPEGMEIDHINTDRLDNRVCNLRYVTPTQNANNPITKFNHFVSTVRRKIENGVLSEKQIDSIVREGRKFL